MLCHYCGINSVDEVNSNLTHLLCLDCICDEISDKAEAWVITANDEATYENFRHEYQIALPYYYADGTVIKAMIRANPGLILMNNGTVIGKWHNNDIPTREEIIKLLN